MKARVKATGEIVDVRIDYKQDADYIAQNGQLYWQRELDFNNLNIKDEEITNTPTTGLALSISTQEWRCRAY